MGRSHQFNEEQKRDLEIIKRKYKHIADILTYDDLVNRLTILLNHFKYESDIIEQKIGNSRKSFLEKLSG